ncbi:MAG TPA: hypothetical protein VGL42_06780 [Opitutaceae bacterium]
MISLSAPFLDDPRSALSWMLRIASYGGLVNTAELLSRPEILREGGLVSWEIGSLRMPFMSVGRWGRFWDFWQRSPVFHGLLWLRVAVFATGLLAPAAMVTHPGAIALSWWLLFLFNRRNHLGQDGADHMLLIIFFAATVASVWQTRATIVLALVLVSFQSALSYVTAGVAKVTAAGWRDGTFLGSVLGTNIYGMAAVGAILRESPVLSAVLSWVLMLWEITFPLAWVVPWPYGAVWVAGGLIFHAITAVVMGLNSFLPAFVAAYPAILYLLKNKGW